ncbi:MAG: hypothetical protein AAF974_10830 [Cyanobacteria bacterium P01_E01_bin.34]
MPHKPFVAWAMARASDEQRIEYLGQLERKLKSLFAEELIQLPKLVDFPNWGHDVQNRYLVEVHRQHQPDDEYRNRVATELALFAR